MNQIERHSLAEELLRRVDELEEQRDDLETLAFAVAHDLRQPLLAAALALEDTIDVTPDPMRDFAKTCIEEAIGRVEDLLRIAGLVHGDPRSEDVVVADVVEPCVARLRMLYPDRALEITTSGDPVVHTDPNILRIVLDNLLENAVRHGYTPDRVLRIDVGLAARTLRVVDDGVGLGLAAHHGRSKRGAGLGLAVCRRAVRALAGGIRMSAPSGGGTAVEITLPDTTRPFRVSGGE